jgi:hypothetical protein
MFLLQFRMGHVILYEILHVCQGHLLCRILRLHKLDKLTITKTGGVEQWYMRVVYSGVVV